MSLCYILYSPNLGKFYTGITSESLDSRLDKHNKKTYGNHRFTANASDWELFLKIDSDSYAHARRIEIRIKKMKSTKFIRELKEDPTKLIQLFEQTK